MGDFEISTPLLLVFACVLLAGGLVSLWMLKHVPGTRWVVLAGLLCISSFDLPKLRDREWQERIGHPQPIGPLQTLRTHARLLTLIPLAVVAGFSVATLPAIRRVPIAHALYLSILAYQMILVAKMVYLDLGVKAIGYSLVFPMNYFIFCFGIATWIQTRDDVLWAARSIGISALIYFALCAVQVVFNYVALFSHQMRFTGMNGNAQHTAVMMGMTLPIVIHLSRRSDELPLLRLGWRGLIGVICFTIVLTGSRTGALMMLVGLGIMYRHYLPYILGAGLLGAIVMIALRSDDAANPFEYYTSRGNTREGTWSEAVEEFESDPIFGYHDYVGQIIFCENSWLAMAAATGLVGLSVMVICFVMMFTRIRKLALYPFRGDERDLGNMIVAAMSAMFIGSVFEAYLLGAIVFPMFAGFTILGMANWLMTEMEARQRASKPTIRSRTQSRPMPQRFPVHPVPRSTG